MSERSKKRACDRKQEHKKECSMERKNLAYELERKKGECVLFVLDAERLSILGQVFRPIFCGYVAEVTSEYVVLEHVNIKMSSAPEYIFPTPLVIPLHHIAWMTPFDCKVRFSLY